MFGNNEILIFNIICWAVVTFIFFRKRKGIDSAVFLLLTFLIYSVCSYIAFNYEYSAFRGKTLTLMPLVYLFLMILLTMSPVLRFNIAKIRSFPEPDYRVLDFLLWVYIICMIIKIPGDLTHIQEGFSQIMLAQGAGLYNDGMNASRQSGGAYVITSLPTIYVNITNDIVILIVFYNLYKKRKRKLTAYTFVALLLSPLGSIANGQRGGAFDVIIMMLGTYFMFAPILDKNIKKKARKIGLIALACFMIPIVALTISRFGRHEGQAENSVYSYMGQQNLNFDLYAFDNNGLRDGDRVFPLFKKMAGYENVPNDFWERRIKYPSLRINDEVFIGYVGDFLLDFGPKVSTVLFICFTSVFLLLTKVRHDRFCFHQLLVIQFVLVLGLQGGLKLYPFADTYALKIFSFLLLYCYLVINGKVRSAHRNIGKRNFT